MKYIVDGKTFDTAAEVAEYITDNMGEEVYDDMLDECYEEIEICGLSYAPSIALYRVDEIAYRCGMTDYYNSLAEDIVYELERMDDGDAEGFYGFEVMALDDRE